MEKEKAIKKIKQVKAIALRDSKDKTVLVETKILKIDRLYKKRFFSNRKMLVHTENEIKTGQVVLICETRPVSRKKAWKVVEVK